MSPGPKPPTIPGARFQSKAQEAWYGSPYSTEEMEAAHREHHRRRKAAAGQPMPRLYRRPYPPYLPGHVDPAWGVPIAGRDLRVGDVLVHIAEHHKIDRLEPYTGSLAGVLGEGARTAYSGTWDIAVGPTATIRILPREGK